MIEITTKLWPTNKPNRNNRMYSEGCFKNINKEDLYPVVFQNDDLTLENILFKAKLEHYDNIIEIKTEPLLNNNKFPRYAEIIKAFEKGELILTPYGYGTTEYDLENNCFLVKDYRLSHFEICSKPSFDYITEVKLL